MDTDTARTLNWQLSRRLGLDPALPHTINAQSECGCWSSYTRDDSFRIWVESGDGHKGIDGYWSYLTDFITSLVKEGQPETLDGVAEATIHPQADDNEEDGCSIATRYADED